MAIFTAIGGTLFGLSGAAAAVAGAAVVGGTVAVAGTIKSVRETKKAQRAQTHKPHKLKLKCKDRKQQEQGGLLLGLTL